MCGSNWIVDYFGTIARNFLVCESYLRASEFKKTNNDLGLVKKDMHTQDRETA